MTKIIKDLSFIFFPPSSRRGKRLKKIAIKFGLAKNFTFDYRYQFWIDNIERYSFLDPIKDKKTKFSIVIPTYNTKSKYLEPLLYSIFNQSYDNFELIIGDASDEQKTSDYIKSRLSNEPRARYIKLKRNEGISANTNKCLENVNGDWVVFVDHDDTLSLHALNEAAAVINEKPSVEIIYSDEDKLTEDGIYRHTPHFKPDWSPHQYLSCNWTSHLSMVKVALVKKVGGLRPDFDGSQDYDLILRILSIPGKRNIEHIPKVLYHWRIAEGSTAGSVSSKSYAVVAGEKALDEYLTTNKINARAVSIEDRPGFYRVKFNPDHKKKAIIVVGASDDKLLNQSYINRLKDSNTSVAKAIFIHKKDFDHNKNKYLDKLRADDAIFFLNRAYSIKNTKWIDELCGVLSLEDVGAVMPKIISPDFRIEDMGIVLEEGKETTLFKNLHENEGTIFGHTEWVRDVYKVSESFSGTTKENLYKRKNGLYEVVWSHITAVDLYIAKGKHNNYNPNIKIDEVSWAPRV